MSEQIYHMPMSEAIKLPLSLLVKELQNEHTELLMWILKAREKANGGKH